MARRNRRNIRLWIFGALAIVLVGAVGVMLPSLLDPNRTKPRLDVAAYAADPASFAGNTYLIDGEIANRLARNRSGSVYSISTANNRLIAVCVPTEKTPPYNLEKGQRLFVDVRIGDDGTAIATTITKK